MKRRKNTGVHRLKPSYRRLFVGRQLVVFGVKKRAQLRDWWLKVIPLTETSGEQERERDLHPSEVDVQQKLMRHCTAERESVSNLSVTWESRHSSHVEKGGGREEGGDTASAWREFGSFRLVSFVRSFFSGSLAISSPRWSNVYNLSAMFKGILGTELNSVTEIRKEGWESRNFGL